MKDGKGISARNPNAQNTPQSHVAGKKDSQWISTTKSEQIAKIKYNKSGVGHAEIDLKKVPSDKVDVSNGIDGASPRVNNYAKKDQEFLIRGTIPADAIKLK